MDTRAVRLRSALESLLGVPSRQVMAAAVAAALAILGLFGNEQWQSYERAIAGAKHDTSNAATLLARHASRTFEGIEETLRAVGRLRTDIARGIYRSQSSIFVNMKTLRGGSPELIELELFNAYGERIATSQHFSPSRTSVAGTELFRGPRETPGDDLHVSVPVRSGVDDSWRVHVSLRLENLDGSFAGVAVGTLDPITFAEVYQSLELGPGLAVTLFRSDGIVLASAKAADIRLGTSEADGPLFKVHLPKAKTGSYHTMEIADETARIGSYTHVDGPGRPLVVDVSVARADALDQFWADFAFDLGTTIAALLVLAAGSWMLVSGLRRRERLQAELAEATAAAHAARAEAETANHAKSDFLARMSHELRTPLNAVIGFAQMLEFVDANSLSARQKEYCGYILNSGEHLLNLVNEVLDLAGVEAGRLVLSDERVALADTLASVAEIMTPVGAKAGIALDFVPATKVPDVRADPLRLRQTIINLVANGIKYNHSGGAVTVTAQALPDDRVRIAVADTGHGIPREMQPALFEPFRRLGGEGAAVEGTGLGLALAKRLVEAMGGSIDFESEPGRGSTFWIDLPTALEDPARGPAPGAGTEAACDRRTVLYIDCDPTGLRLMERALATRADLSSLSASTPQLGVDLAAGHRPDAIIVDLDLPELGADGLLDHLQRLPETRDIPVIAYASASSTTVARRGLATGRIFRVLAKPIDVKQLFEVLDAALAAMPKPAAASSR